MRLIVRQALFAAALTATSLTAAHAGDNPFQDLLKAVDGPHHSAQLGRSLPTTEIAAALREALATGTQNAIRSLGRKNGFWNNPKVRIPLPGKLEQAANLARTLGQGAQVDAFELSMNRAAEMAVPQVAQIFGDAIRKMTLSDARRILTGDNHAATDYFRRVAGQALAARIHPIVAAATDRVGVTRKYKAFTSSGAGSEIGGALGALESFGGKPANHHGSLFNLDDYVTRETLDGLFTVIGEEEQSIRENPAARGTALLKKVFGG
ncbi:MAG: DUF4197 domain-containing protein [Steroidobacteraceae bacterium]|nr:DUF4197 domain-containing protein [Steroidobacteraceae bacterium]